MSSKTFLMPPEVGDGHDYDMIAFNLAEGSGFGYHWSSPEWRQPYAAFADDSRYDSLLQRHGEYTPTAYRPPGFPSILASLYAVFGREFWIWRLVNALLAAVAYGFATIIAARIGGPLAAGVCFLLGCTDGIFLAYTSLFMSEVLSSALLMAVIYVLFFHGASSGPERPKIALIAGILLGALCLTRWIFVVYGVVLLLALMLYLRHRHPIFSLANLGHAALISLVVVAPLLLWGWRNLDLSGHFLPLGTHGGYIAGTSFSDDAMSNRGVWQPLAKARQVNYASAYFQNLTGIEAEAAVGAHMSRVARLWIIDNSSLLIELSLLKLRSYWWDTALPFQIFMVLLGTIGAVFSSHRGLCLIFFALIVAQVVGAVLLYALPAGRFLVPFHPVFALGVAGMFCSPIFKRLLVGKGVLSA